jgi:hypothetical protein
MSDAGEGLVDTDARLQERIEEREQERRLRREGKRDVNPERLRLLESLRLARTELERQSALTPHPARREQIALAIAEVDRRLAEA